VGGNGEFIYFSVVGERERRPLRDILANTPRLILTEGLFTVLLGIYTFFFLPDCKITFFPFSISST
jgi:hypothetical protein